MGPMTKAGSLRTCPSVQWVTKAFHQWSHKPQVALGVWGSRPHTGSQLGLSLSREAPVSHVYFKNKYSVLHSHPRGGGGSQATRDPPWQAECEGQPSQAPHTCLRCFHPPPPGQAVKHTEDKYSMTTVGCRVGGRAPSDFQGSWLEADLGEGGGHPLSPGSRRCR